MEFRTSAAPAVRPESPMVQRVGLGFISLYTLAYMGTILLLVAPVLVSTWL